MLKHEQVPHDWVKSTLGHGEAMCSRCLITNREAAVLQKLNACDVPPKADTDAQFGNKWWDDTDTYGAS